MKFFSSSEEIQIFVSKFFSFLKLEEELFFYEKKFFKKRVNHSVSSIFETPFRETIFLKELDCVFFFF